LTLINLNIPLISRYYHLTDILYNEIEATTTATNCQSFATEYGLKNQKSILDLLKRKQHLQTPQNVYHLTAGKIQRLLNIIINLFSQDGKHAFITT